MDRETIILVIIPALGLLLPFVGTQVGHWVNRRKLAAEARKLDNEAGNIELQGQQVIVGAATSVVELLRGELERRGEEFRAELAVEREARVAAVQAEKKAREADARKCAEDIRKLKAAENFTNRKLSKVIDYIYRRWGVRVDTDELRTPPPHQVPRPNWQEPDPIDEAPNE